MAKPYEVSKTKRGLRSFYIPHDRYYAEVYGDSRTRQEFADECDINQIMKRFEKTGALTHFNRSAPKYLDLTMTPTDLQSALGLMQDAEKAFMRLPASVRREFDNDPMRFVQFAENGENIEQMRKWGLAPESRETLDAAVKPLKIDEHTAQFAQPSPPKAPKVPPAAKPKGDEPAGD